MPRSQLTSDTVGDLQLRWSRARFY